MEFKGLLDEVCPTRAMGKGRDSGLRQRSRDHHREVGKTRGDGGSVLLITSWMVLSERLGPVNREKGDLQGEPGEVSSW